MADTNDEEGATTVTLSLDDEPTTMEKDATEFTLDAPPEDEGVSEEPAVAEGEPINVEISLGDEPAETDGDGSNTFTLTLRDDEAPATSEPVAEESASVEVTLPEPEPTQEVAAESVLEPAAAEESPTASEEPAAAPETTVSESAPEPAAEEPALAPEVPVPELAPEPAAENSAPTPEAPVSESAPDPAAEEPAPEAIVKEPTPAPASEPVVAQEPAPVVEVVEPEPAPEPTATAEEPVSTEPAVEVTVPEPISEEPVATKEATPVKEAIPEETKQPAPSAEEPVIEVVISEPVPEPAAVEVAAPVAEAAPETQDAPEPESSTEAVTAPAPEPEPVVVSVPEPAPTTSQKPECEPISVKIEDEPADEEFVEASALSPAPVAVKKPAPEKVSSPPPPKPTQEAPKPQPPKIPPPAPTEKVSSPAPTKDKAKTSEETQKKADINKPSSSVNKNDSIPASKAEDKKKKEGMTTLAIDLADIEGDADAPIEVVVPPPAEEKPKAAEEKPKAQEAPKPEPAKAAAQPSKTEPLSVSVDVGQAAGDEFRTPTHETSSPSKTKSISFAASVTPIAAAEPGAVKPDAYMAPQFSPSKSPKSPNPQAFVPANLDESLRETYMEHVAHYTNRILPFTQSAKTLVTRQSTLLDRLRSMRGEMERAERELDLACDEFEVLKRTTRGKCRRFMADDLEAGVCEGEEGLDDDGGLLMTSSAMESSPYRPSYRRGRSVAADRPWYSSRSTSARRYLDETDEDTSRYKFRTSRFAGATSGSGSSSSNRKTIDGSFGNYLRTKYRSRFDYGPEVDAAIGLCEHDAGGIPPCEEEEPSYTYSSSVGRFSSYYGGTDTGLGMSMANDEADLLKSTRRFENTLRSLRTNYSSLSTTSDDLSRTTTLHAV